MWTVQEEDGGDRLRFAYSPAVPNHETGTASTRAQDSPAEAVHTCVLLVWGRMREQAVESSKTSSYTTCRLSSSRFTRTCRPCVPPAQQTGSSALSTRSDATARHATPQHLPNAPDPRMQTKSHTAPPPRRRAVRRAAGRVAPRRRGQQRRNCGRWRAAVCHRASVLARCRLLLRPA